MTDRGESSDFPLGWAAASGDVDLTARLLDAGARVNEGTPAKWSDGSMRMNPRPLHRAVEGGHKAVVALLIERGADVNAQDAFLRTPLMGCRDVDIAAVLLDHGAEIDAGDEYGKTPLMYGRHPDVTAFLLSRGADPRRVNKAGREVAP